MAFRPSDVIGLIWHHPIVSIFVVLLFTPPLFPIVVYFSPLLISTALFVLAMISMESDHAKEFNAYGMTNSYSKRVWIEEVEVNGPLLGAERLPKRLKALSNDETWLDKVKNWEGTGRAWVESVLSQEARKSSDSISSSRDDSFPLLDKARGFFVEDVRKSLRDDEPSSGEPSDEDGAVVAVESTLSVHVTTPIGLGIPSSPVGEYCGQFSSKIMPNLESEDDLIEIAPASIPPSPLFRNKLLAKADENVSRASDPTKKSENFPSEAISENVESAGGSVPRKDSKDQNTASGVDSTNEGSIPLVVAQKMVEIVPADLENTSKSGDIAIPWSVSVAMEINSVAKETITIVNSVAKEAFPRITPEIRNVSSEVTSVDATDRSLAAIESEKGKPGLQPNENKSAAELLAPLRQGQASYGLGTPSAAVALSEKLKVPLADIMSLLAGEGKENAPVEGPSGVEMSSSSETTTSQEEEWSASDVESSEPATTVRGASSEKNH